MNMYVQRHAQYSFFSTHALQSYGFQLGGPHQLIGAYFIVQVAPLHRLQKYATTSANGSEEETRARAQ